MTRPAKSDRYLALDGYRGLAAIAVAMYHLDRRFVPGGYLAVDFFFALSGFVLLRTYESRIKSDISVIRFMVLRGIRLFPLHTAAIAIGVLWAIQGLIRNSEFHMTAGAIGCSLMPNILLLPSPCAGLLFPMNGVEWSLFYEVIINIIMAKFLIRLSNITLFITIAVSVTALIYLAYINTLSPEYFIYHGEPLNNGDRYQGWYMGPLRTIISFTLGMLIARLAPTKQRPPTFWAVLAGFFMVSMLTIQTPLSFRTPLDLAIILIVSPGLLIIGSRFEVPALFVSSAIRLGDLPFALYAIHLPFARGSQFVAHHFHFPPALLAPIFLPLSLGLAWCCVQWIDKPLRRVLSTKLLPLVP